ncbi:MAG: FtsX-like permease family protein [Candidatus Dormiibacterota bacterium]
MSDIWGLAARAIRARPLRSVLTAAAVALGIAVVLAVQIAIQGLTVQASEAKTQLAGASSLDVRVDAGSGLTASEITELGALPGVVQAVPLYEKQVTAGPVGTGLTGDTVTLVGLQDSSAALRSVSVVAGRLPLPGSTTEVAIDQGLSTALSGGVGPPIHIGQGIQMITATGPDEFTVVGFTAGTVAGPSFTHDAVFVDDAAMLGPFGLGLRTPLVALRFGPGATVARVASEVHARFGSSVTTYDPRAGGSAPLQDLEPLLVLATVLSLIVGAGVTANSAALATFERRREIGLLRAAGASSRQVFRLFAAEVATVAVAGVPIGVAGGLILGAVFNSNLSPSDLAAPSLTPQAGQVGAAIAAGLGAALIGGLLPLFAAARLPILSSLRPHPISEHERAGVLVRTASPVLLVIAALCFLSTSSGLVALGVVALLLGLVVALPLIAPLVISLSALAISPFVSGAQPGAAHLTRARNRTAMTTAGLAIAVASAVGVSALSAGALTASDSWVSHLFAGDMVVTSPVTQDDQIASAISSTPGVSQSTALRFLSETVAGASVGVAAIDPGAYAALGGLDVVSGDRATALAALEDGPSFLEPAGLASATGWTVGSQLPVQTQKGIVYFTVVGIVSHSFPAGDGGESLVMADDLARTYFGSTAYGFDDLVITTHGNAPALAGTAASYGMRAVSVSVIESDARDALQHSIGLVLAVAIISVIIAMLAVVNTLLVNTRQGTRELALLRAVGLGSRQAMRRVLTEAGLLAGAATLIGVAAGCLIAVPMLQASTTSTFAPGFVFPIETVIVVILVVVLAAVVAAIGPARRAVRTSVLSALRDE